MKRSEVHAVALGMALTLAAVFVAVSLITWNVGDPQLLANYEDGQPAARNRCGAGGALIASYLFRAHGAAGYAVPIALGALGVFFLVRRSAETGLRRAAGGAIVVIGLSLFAGTFSGGMLASAMAYRSIDGPGGAFGAVPVALLARYLGGVGTYLVILFTLSGGMLLVSRSLVEQALEVVGRWVLKTAPALIAATFKAFVPRKKRDANEILDKLLGEETPKKVLESFSETTAPKQPNATQPLPAPSGILGMLASGESNRQSEAKTRRMPPKRPTIAKLATGKYQLPPVDLLLEEEEHDRSIGQEVKERGVRVVQTFTEFNIDTKLVDIVRGPAVTMYELELAPGINVNRVTSLSNNISMAMAAHDVRILAPIPGKATVGIEVPNAKQEIVRLRPVLETYLDSGETYALPMMLGRDAAGRPLYTDLARMPHLLVAGSTGSGKSVCIDGIIMSLVMTKRPDQLKMLLVDPKVVELSRYRGIPHLASPVVTEMKRAAFVLNWAVQKMEERYRMLGVAGMRDIATFNNLEPHDRKARAEAAGADEPEQFARTMPYIVIIVDELADLMMVAAKEVEISITRLAQKSRATGIHVVLATQRPSVDVLTGLIRANMPTKISFQVTSRLESRIILDQNGAEKLLGRGDMLFLPPGAGTPLRAKGVFLTEEEIACSLEHIRMQPEIEAAEDFEDPMETGLQAEDDGDFAGGSDDALYDDAVKIVLTTQRGSVSLLQRRLSIGYTRAGKLIDMMAADGILGPHQGSKPREMLMTIEEWEERQAGKRKSA